MSDIKSLHKTARTLILNLRDGLEQLERSENVGDHAAIFVKAEGLLVRNLPRLQRAEPVWFTGTSLWRCHRLVSSTTAEAVGLAEDQFADGKHLAYASCQGEHG